MTTYGPYTPVRQAGNLLFVSGQIGINPNTKRAAVDIETQTQQALANLAAVLKEAGAGLGDVVKTTVFLANMNDFAAMNAVYEKAFMAPRPARSAVGVRELPRLSDAAKLLVEIEAVAHKAQS
jgi:2-iminobutanoate/2-iminopropanoate deaminase